MERSRTGRGKRERRKYSGIYIIYYFQGLTLLAGQRHIASAVEQHRLQPFLLLEGGGGSFLQLRRNLCTLSGVFPLHLQPHIASTHPGQLIHIRHALLIVATCAQFGYVRLAAGTAAIAQLQIVLGKEAFLLAKWQFHLGFYRYVFYTREIS